MTITLTRAVADKATEQAVAWYARLASESVTRDEQRAFETWCHCAPGNEAAYRKVMSALATVDVALADTSAPARLFERSPDSGRQLPRTARVNWQIALAAAVALIAVLSFAHFLPESPELTVAATAVGATRSEHLPDGSTVLLNTDTRVSFAIGESSRVVRFEGGEAFFNVAPDPERPFVIAVGGREVRVVGTSFNVKASDGHTDVTVAEGTVRLTDKTNWWSAVLPPDTSQVLTAGMQASYDEQSEPVVTRVTPAVVAPWRHGQVIYRRERLEDVIADLDRYFEGSFVVQGQGAADLRVSAVINLGDKATVLGTLGRQLPIRVEELDGGVTRIALAEAGSR
jgi:transmembrane sensor